MDETVWVYRETVTLVRVARPDGGGPDRVVPAAGARLGRVGTWLVLAALGVASARLAARRSTAARLARPGEPRAVRPHAATSVGESGRAA